MTGVRAGRSIEDWLRAAGGSGVSSAGPARGGAPWRRFSSTGTVTTDDRLTGNDPDCGPAAGDSLVVTKFDHLARSLPEAEAIAVEVTVWQLR